jgi:hypothetical protein
MKMQNTGFLIFYVGFLMHVPLECLYSQKEKNSFICLVHIGFSDETSIQEKKKVHVLDV